MTRLELAKLINKLAGTQGTVDTTVNTTGYQSTLIAFLDQAYNDLQIFRDTWKFMREEAPIPLSTIVDSYSSDDIATVDRIIYNKRLLREIPYDDWILSDHATGKPVEYTVDPSDDSITFNPSDTDYILTLQYYKVPDLMETNSAVPILPVRFHNVLAYKALIGLGSYLGNDDLITRYSLKYSIELGQLMRSQVPKKMITTRPLV